MSFIRNGSAEKTCQFEGIICAEFHQYSCHQYQDYLLQYQDYQDTLPV